MVSGLWNVTDECAPELMKVFFERPGLGRTGSEGAGRLAASILAATPRAEEFHPSWVVNFFPTPGPFTPSRETRERGLSNSVSKCWLRHTHVFRSED